MKITIIFLLSLFIFNTNASDSSQNNEDLKKCLVRAKELPWYHVNSEQFICLNTYIDGISMDECESHSKDAQGYNGTQSWRLKCLNKLREFTNFETCMSIADKLPFYSQPEQKLKCFDQFKDSISFQQCESKSDTFANASEVSNWRQKCLDKFRTQISFDQCIETTEKLPWFLNYKQKEVCLDINRNRISFEECEKVARLLRNNNQNNAWRWKCYDYYTDTISYNQCLENANKLSNNNATTYMTLKCNKILD